MRETTPSELPCFCCGEMIPHGDPGLRGNILSTNWDGAGTIEIDCGYGSRHDMERHPRSFHGVVCDGCIEKNAARLMTACETYQSRNITSYVRGIERPDSGNYHAELVVHFEQARDAILNDLNGRIEMWKGQSDDAATDERE